MENRFEYLSDFFTYYMHSAVGKMTEHGNIVFVYCEICQWNTILIQQILPDNSLALTLKKHSSMLFDVMICAHERRRNVGLILSCCIFFGRALQIMGVIQTVRHVIMRKHQYCIKQKVCPVFIR